MTPFISYPTTYVVQCVYNCLLGTLPGTNSPGGKAAEEKEGHSSASRARKGVGKKRHEIRENIRGKGTGNDW